DATPEPKRLEQQLEGVLDRLQPGWREAVVERRVPSPMGGGGAPPRGGAGGPSRRPRPAGPQGAGPVVAGASGGAGGGVRRGGEGPPRGGARAGARARSGRRGGVNMPVSSARSLVCDVELQAHERLLWNLCYRMTGVAADADDLVQETFLRAIERPPPDTGSEL